MTRSTTNAAAVRAWMRDHRGLITRERALALGATSAWITARVRRGEWIRAGRGVYRDVVVAATPERAIAAACLAVGPVAVASHGSAAWLWGLLEQPPARPELSVPGRDQHGRRTPGVVVHQSGDLHRSALTTRHGIPVTGAARTVVDLAASSVDQVPGAFERGVAARLITPAEVAAELDRLARRGRPGVAAARRALARAGVAGAPAASVLEARAGRLFEQAHLPRPRRELTAGPGGSYRLDYAYPAQRLAVEVDGYLWHGAPAQTARDHARRNRLLADGWRVLVYTWRDAVDEPTRVIAEITAAYGRAA